jgi:hypothetical protein
MWQKEMTKAYKIFCQYPRDVYVVLPQNFFRKSHKALKH